MKDYFVWVCNFSVGVPELLLWECTRLWLMRGGWNTNKVFSYVKSGNFIRDKHECREQVNTMNNKYRMTVRLPA